MKPFVFNSIWDRRNRNELNLMHRFIRKFDGSSLIEQTHNLFNPDAVVSGRLSGGEVVEDSTYVTSDFMEVSGGYIRVNTRVGLYLYDENYDYKDWIPSSSTEGPIKLPSGTRYVRTSMLTRVAKDFMLYDGVEEKPFVEFGLIYSKESIHLEAYIENLNTTDSYIRYSDGVELPSNNYSATSYIPITPLTVYAKNATGQMAFYSGMNENDFVGGVGSTVQDMMFITPPNAKFVRFSIPKGREDNFKFERIENNKASSVKGIFEELLNPFKHSYIKMIGDSNVMGSGGSGYSRTDVSNQEVPGYPGMYFNEKGYCWANELRDLLIEKFEREQIVGLNHQEIKPVQSAPVSTYNNAAISSCFTTIGSKSPVTFTFYGTDFTLFTMQSNGVAQIYIDDTLVRTISETNVNNEEHLFNGLSPGYHKVELKVSSGQMVFSGIKIQKSIIAKNYGVSGAGTDYIIRNIDNLIDGEETIVMSLVGSNDRIPESSADTTSHLVENLKTIYLSILNKGANPVLLSSTPASISNETDLDRDFDKGDIDTATSIAAAFFGYEHISVYNYILEYSELTGTPIDSLLSDGVHPNDEGYRLAFNYICKEIGIGRKRPDATW